MITTYSLLLTYCFVGCQAKRWLTGSKFQLFWFFG
jgi:hypothetical protein